MHPHSQQPQSTEVIIHYVNQLLHKFLAGDAATMALLATRQLFVVPLVNPDGYAYNEGIAASIRWMRKNRNADDGACSAATSGVDLNRNYDMCTDHHGTGDNRGASDLPCEEDYRGRGPFSEPETQAIKAFIEQPADFADGTYDYAFSFALNFHSFGRSINIPYSCQGTAMAPERLALYERFAGMMTEPMPAATRWGFGRSWESIVNYPVWGEASDWMEAQHQIFAMSPEVGPEFSRKPVLNGFWPAPSEVQSLAMEAAPVMDVAYDLTGPSLRLSDLTLACTISVSVDNAGVKPAAGDTLTLAFRGTTWVAFASTATASVPALSAVPASVAVPGCHARRLRRGLAAVNPSTADTAVLSYGGVCVVYTITNGEIGRPQRALADHTMCTPEWMVPSPLPSPSPSPSPSFTPTSPFPSPTPSASAPATTHQTGASPVPSPAASSAASSAHASPVPTASPTAAASATGSTMGVFPKLSHKQVKLAGFLIGVIVPAVIAVLIVCIVKRRTRRYARLHEGGQVGVQLPSASAGARSRSRSRRRHRRRRGRGRRAADEDSGDGGSARSGGCRDSDGSGGRGAGRGAGDGGGGAAQEVGGAFRDDAVSDDDLGFVIGSDTGTGTDDSAQGSDAGASRRPYRDDDSV